jgi:hypothetical protein
VKSASSLGAEPSVGVRKDPWRKPLTDMRYGNECVVERSDFGCTVIAGQQLKALVRPAFEPSSGQYQAELRLLGSRTYEDVLDLKLKWIGGRRLPANLLSRTLL